MVEANRSSVIISAHHYVLKDTTVASGEWEGMQRTESGAWKPRYHGYFPQGTPQGASFLYWVDSKQDSGAFEERSGGSALKCRFMARSTHSHDSRRYIRREIAYRAAMGHDVYQRRCPDPLPYSAGNRRPEELAADIHRW